jgi:DNA-binding MarR family transcriptional regulator
VEVDIDPILAEDRQDLLDPRRLLVFAEVARSGSLAGAAHALGWTQQAVAQHVKRLERDTGCALVIRNSRGVTLTEAGHSIATACPAPVNSCSTIATPVTVTLPEFVTSKRYVTVSPAES